MDTLHFSDNLLFLRRKKGITQEALADFIGVTKASVSKWENKQSFPDILLLPYLASFFDVTVDELLGYEPQLSKEQIQKFYYDLASDFGQFPFEDVMKRCNKLIKKYYSCYPFLLQMAILYLNHFMLSDTPQRQIEILTEASNLCSHILSNCTNIGICNDSTILKAAINLQLQNPKEVIDVLEELQNPYRLVHSSDTLLVKAYELEKNMEKADQFAQISLFNHLISLIQNSTLYLRLHNQEPTRCNEIIHRTNELIQLFHVDQLHPNSSILFYYEVSIIFCMQQNKELALDWLKKYVHLLLDVLDNDKLTLHGDSYFPQLDNWFEQSPLGSAAPRDITIIRNSAAQSLCHPAFSILDSEKTFKMLKKAFYNNP